MATTGPSKGMLSTTRSRALLAALITVLLVTALILYILYGEKKPQSPLKNSSNSSSLAKNLTTDSGVEGVEGSGDAPLTEATDSESQLPLINDDENISTTESSTEPTSTTEAVSTTAFKPIDDKTKAGLPECSAISKTGRPTCEVENQPPRAAYEKWTKWDTRNGSIDLISDVQPLHYDLNISISNADSRLLKASAEIFLRVSTKTSSIPLHLDRTIINLNATQIFVRNCQTGEFVCVKSIAQLIEKQLVVLVLSTPVDESSLISVYFENFDVQLYSNLGLVLQSPSHWEKQRAWILGSLFDKVGARTVFPSIDQPEVKASWRLCTQHPSNMTARSNMASETVLEREDNTIQNCFQKSPPLRPDHFSFVIFDNLLAIHSDTKSPSVEVFVAKHLREADNKWIVVEVQTALKKMADITGVEYPQSKLTVISMPLLTDAFHAYGLINIKESWVEYQKYLLTHTILNTQVVKQWISNVFTICDQCIQDGLANYLEWLVSADFESVNIEPKRRALEVKQKLLRFGNDRSPLQALLIEPSKNEDECVSRASLIFAMLDETFGIEAMKRFVQALTEAKSWSTCASNKEISDMLVEATLSPVSQEIFNSFFKSKNYPILRLKLEDSKLGVKSESSNKDESHLFTVAYSVLNEDGKPVNLISNGSDATHEFSGQTVVINPISDGFFRTIYNIDNYKRLVDCSVNGQCNKLPKENLDNVYTDLCWALLSNRLESSKNNVTQWHELFGQITSANLVHGDCQCCMQSRSKSNAQCKWVWKDKCAKLDLKIDQ